MISSRTRSLEKYLSVMGIINQTVASALNIIRSEPGIKSFLIGFVLLFGAVTHPVERAYIWKS